MKSRFRRKSRGARGGAFYCVDSFTGKRTSLGTTDRDAAEQIVLARNQALRQPSLNLHIAKAYLAGSDSGVNTRTWGDALNAIVESKQGPTRSRWAVAAKDKAFDGIRDAVLIETRAETLLEAIRRGTVSPNDHLRKLHNYCLDMGWLPWPIIPKRQDGRLPRALRPGSPRPQQQSCPPRLRPPRQGQAPGVGGIRTEDDGTEGRGGAIQQSSMFGRGRSRANRGGRSPLQPK